MPKGIMRCLQQWLFIGFKVLLSNSNTFTKKRKLRHFPNNGWSWFFWVFYRLCNTVWNHCFNKRWIDINLVYPRVTSKTVTVELTSKHYKKKQVTCYILMLLGLSGCVVGGLAGSKIIAPGGFISFWIGAIWLLIVRFQIWWNHGWNNILIILWAPPKHYH